MGKETTLFHCGLMLAAGAASARLATIHDGFDYGSKGSSNVPGWYDQSGGGEYYNKAADANSPFDPETGSVGFHWNEGTGQFLYVFMGWYDGEPCVRFGFDVANYNNTPERKSQYGEFIVGLHKNNAFLPADDLDVAADPDTVAIDRARIAFTLTGPGAMEHLAGNLDLSKASLASGDRLYFRIQYANPANRTFHLDNLSVVPCVVPCMGSACGK